MDGFVNPRLEIRFDPDVGPDSLTILGPDGSRFLTFTEWAETARAEQQRANAEQQRAELAEGRVAQSANLELAERQRAEGLAARLRELGVEPE